MHVEGCSHPYGGWSKTPPEDGQKNTVPLKALVAYSSNANMEVFAKNSGLDFQSVSADFESQLRELDKEMGLFNEDCVVLNAKDPMPILHTTIPNPCTQAIIHPQEHTKVKGPLTDITNTPKTRVGSRKKKARAHGIETGGPLVALPEKRHSDFLNEVSEDYCRPGKDPRTTPMDIVSAEANNSQPHRDQ